MYNTHPGRPDLLLPDHKIGNQLAYKSLPWPTRHHFRLGPLTLLSSRLTLSFSYTRLNVPNDTGFQKSGLASIVVLWADCYRFAEEFFQNRNLDGGWFQLAGYPLKAGVNTHRSFRDLGPFRPICPAKTENVGGLRPVGVGDREEIAERNVSNQPGGRRKKPMV